VSEFNFTRELFEDKIRATLRVHLGGVLPSRLGQEMDAILNLIHDVSITAASRAQELLDAHLETLPNVYGGIDMANGRRKWDIRKSELDTHSAKLFGVKELK